MDFPDFAPPAKRAQGNWKTLQTNSCAACNCRQLKEARRRGKSHHVFSDQKEQFHTPSQMWVKNIGRIITLRVLE